MKVNNRVFVAKKQVGKVSLNLHRMRLGTKALMDSYCHGHLGGGMNELVC